MSTVMDAVEGPAVARRRPGPARVLRRLAQRVGELALVAGIVVVLSTLLIHLAPGDPARIILGPRAQAAQVTALRDQLGLDKPVSEQVAVEFRALARGDLGTSIISRGQSVSGIVGDALPITLSVIAGALIVAIAVGIPLGLIAAVSPRRLLRDGISALALVVLAIPPFALALILLLAVALGLHLAPAGGWGEGTAEHLRHVWLPSLALSGLVLPQVLRTVRQTAGAVVSHDFIEAAQARGLSPTRIVLRNILPNCLLPVVAVLGLNAAMLIAGAVVVEAVFGLPGLGGALQDAVQNRDYPVIQGIALATALGVILVSLLVDVLSVALDPRIRTAR